MNVAIKRTSFLGTLLILTLSSACKKGDWVTPIRLGTTFNYKELKWLKKPNGDVPSNPFTVDSVVVSAYSGYNGYWVSSANGLTYIMDPLTIRKGSIKSDPPDK